MNNDAQTPPDRRALRRDATQRPAQIATPAIALDARVVDISPNGLQVRCATPLKSGARIEVEVHPRAGEGKGQVYLVRGIVVRCDPSGAEYAIGVRLATRLGETEDLHGPSFASADAAAQAVNEVTALLRQWNGAAPSPLAYAAHRASEPPAAPAPEPPPKRRRAAALLLLPLLLLLLLLWRGGPLRNPPDQGSPALGDASFSTSQPPASLAVDALFEAMEKEDALGVRDAVITLVAHRDATATQRLIAALGAATLPREGRPARLLEFLPYAVPEWQALAQAYLRATPSETGAPPLPLGDFQTVAWYEDLPPESGSGQPTPGSGALPERPASAPGTANDSAPEPTAAASSDTATNATTPLDGVGGPLIPLPDTANTTVSPPPQVSDPGPSSDPARAAAEVPPASGEEDPPLRVDVDTDNFILTVMRGRTPVKRFPVGLGREASTPTGQFRIANKLVNPAWYNRGTVVPPGDPANAIGAYWMGLGRDGKATRYGIHPTNDPAAIGAEKSRGCIRMRPEDAAQLFELIPLGTPVTIR